MNEFSPVSKDVEKSGLIDFLSNPPKPFHYHYYLLLDEMAKLADQNGGREFSATHLQLADRIEIDRKLEQNTRVKTIASMVNEMIRVGILESVSKDTPNRYRFPTRQRLNEIAKELEEGKIHLSPVRTSFRKR